MIERMKKDICEIGRRMYAKNLVSATDGNMSIRLDTDHYLCTPSGIPKGYMTPGDLLIADGKGNVIDGKGKITSEFFTHLAAYAERPDIKAVCHAHPPTAVALTLAQKGITPDTLPELVMALGNVPVTPYATPAGEEGGQVIRSFIRDHDAVLLDRHGLITVGADIFDAYYKLERVEHAAQILLAAHLLGSPKELLPEEVHKLRAAGEKYKH